jgi:hypothetical protein
VTRRLASSALLAALGLLTRCTRGAPAGPSHAAVAFRDDVPGYQKFASEQYTVHHLEKRYELVTYVEATAGDDGQKRLLDAIEAAALKHDTVDLFFLSHGGHYDAWCTGLSPAARAKLRLVYNTGAGNSAQGPRWLTLGARAYVGHPAGNVAPLFLTYFLPAWVGGAKLRAAVDDANTQTRDDLLGTVAGGVAGVLDAVGGPHLDRPKLAAGTEAELFGDDTLTVR